MTETVLALVDKQDRLLGKAGADECHLGNGLHHRAFVTILYDANDRLILQRRRHLRFDGLWDLSAVSHPHITAAGIENYQSASDRALKRELGIVACPVQRHAAFNYFARDGRHCENEYCAILLGRFTGRVKPNPSCVYETARMSLPLLLRNIQAAPRRYTPWAQQAAHMAPAKLSDL